MQVKAIVNTFGNFLQKNSPYILTGLGCAGVVTTAVMTGQAAVRAHDTLKEHELGVGMEEHFKDKNFKQEDLVIPMKEKVLLTWKYFVPPVVMGATSVACIIGAQTVNTRRHAALTSLYTLTEQTLKDYKEKVIEQVGKNKANKIEEEMAQDILDAHPLKNENIILTSHGKTLCYDVYSGRYFTHDIEKLRRIENDFNHDLMGDHWLSLNDLYYLIGLESIKAGEDFGWYVEDLLEFKFTSKLADNNEPCLVVDYKVYPRHVRRGSWGGL